MDGVRTHRIREDLKENWHNYLTLGAMFGALIALYGVAYNACGPPAARRAESEAMKPDLRYELITKNLNCNGKPEKFYEINGKKYFLEIDGKNLESRLVK